MLGSSVHDNKHTAINQDMSRCTQEVVVVVVGTQHTAATLWVVRKGYGYVDNAMANQRINAPWNSNLGVRGGSVSELIPLAIQWADAVHYQACRLLSVRISNAKGSRV